MLGDLFGGPQVDDGGEPEPEELLLIGGGQAVEAVGAVQAPPASGPFRPGLIPTDIPKVEAAAQVHASSPDGPAERHVPSVEIGGVAPMAAT